MSAAEATPVKASEAMAPAIRSLLDEWRTTSPKGGKSFKIVTGRRLPQGERKLTHHDRACRRFPAGVAKSAQSGHVHGNLMRRVIPSKGGFVDEAADDSYREGCRTLLRSRDS